MKVGDTVAVNIGAFEVARAEVKEINDGEAVLIVPARRVVMGIRSELTDLTPKAPEKETIIDGVDRPVPAEPSAPVDDTTPSAPVAPVEKPEVAEVPVQSVEAPAPVSETVAPPVATEASGADNVPSTES